MPTGNYIGPRRLLDLSFLRKLGPIIHIPTHTLTSKKPPAADRSPAPRPTRIENLIRNLKNRALFSGPKTTSLSEQIIVKDYKETGLVLEMAAYEKCLEITKKYERTFDTALDNKSNLRFQTMPVLFLVRVRVFHLVLNLLEFFQISFVHVGSVIRFYNETNKPRDRNFISHRAKNETRDKMAQKHPNRRKKTPTPRYRTKRKQVAASRATREAKAYHEIFIYRG